jgi:catechol 2,3-dioxygenase-like lactoylglutathione lyase family enzyme
MSQNSASTDPARQGTVNIAAVAVNIRVARPTSQIEDLLKFYCDGLGLERIDGFRGHRGFSGVMVGLPDARFHIEFTSHEDSLDHLVGLAPTKDNLLVFYVADDEQFRASTERMSSLGYSPVPPENPYWTDRKALTYEDPDGWRVVIVPSAYS